MASREKLTGIRPSGCRAPGTGTVRRVAAGYQACTPMVGRKHGQVLGTFNRRSQAEAALDAWLKHQLDIG